MGVKPIKPIEYEELLICGNCKVEVYNQDKMVKYRICPQCGEKVEYDNE